MDPLDHSQSSAVVALLQQLLGAIQRNEGEPGRGEGGGSGGGVRKVEGGLKINIGVDGSQTAPGFIRVMCKVYEDVFNSHLLVRQHSVLSLIGPVRMTRLISKISSALERRINCRWHGGGAEVVVDLHMHSPGREKWEVEVHILNSALVETGW